MTKNVKISICGIQEGPHTDGEEIETLARGEYYCKNNKHYILYEEHPEGEALTIKNRIKFASGYLELIKSGAVNTRMVFEEHKKNRTDYQTPFGALQMGVDTAFVKVEESEDEIRVLTGYALEINEEHTADCRLTITIRSEQL